MTDVSDAKQESLAGLVRLLKFGGPSFLEALFRRSRGSCPSTGLDTAKDVMSSESLCLHITRSKQKKKQNKNGAY
jgi:hypothetical protein